MSEQLVIRLAETGLNAEQQVDWSLFDDSGQTLDSGSNTLASLYQHINEQTSQCLVTVIVPGESVLLTAAAVPSRQLRQIKQALPFMIEELIADDIESVHLAIPAALDVNAPLVDVAVVSHRAMVDWLDELHSNQLSPDTLVADVLCLPYQQAGITLLLDQHNILIRTGQYAGLVVQKDDFGHLFPAVLEQLQQQAEVAVKPALSVLYSNQQDQAQATALLDDLRATYHDYDIKAVSYDEPIFAVLANASCQQEQPSLNLLQGGYAVNHRDSSPWQQWRLAASVAAIGIVSYVVLTLAGGWYFQSKADQLDQQSIALYKQLFPNERRVVSPKKQMENHLRLAGVTGNGHFLELLAQTAQQFTDQDQSLDLLVEALRFDSDRGDLQFQVQGPSIEKLDQLKQLLAQQGLIVDINSATEQDDHIVGRFVVRRL